MASVRRISPSEPLELADGVFWVGHHHPGDPFQAHAYLVVHGDQSVLIDPGSPRTFATTLSKIERLIPFDQIRYFVCQHQDPDITAALPEIGRRVRRDDACIVTHWRAATLLKHYDVELPFWRVEQHDWRLELGGRELEFVFTPYAHFPGAFCTFDRRTGVLFSSDLFGGFTDGFTLFAEEDWIMESIRPFHEHYIASREVLGYALDRLARYPIQTIAPQHGAIIEKPLIDLVFDGLRSVECGLYLQADVDTEIHRLSQLNRAVADVTRTLVVSRHFRETAEAVLQIVRRVLPISGIEFYAHTATSGALHLEPATQYSGILVHPPGYLSVVLQSPLGDWLDGDGARGWVRVGLDDFRLDADGLGIVVPLYNEGDESIHAAALLRLEGNVRLDADAEQMLARLRTPLLVAVEREAITRMLDLERQRFYERSIRDPLTQCFTRYYMHDAVVRMFSLHDRDAGAPVALAMFDIDRFKSVNDEHGHSVGDQVLRLVSTTLLEQSRTGDLPVRLGGEEFGVFVVGNAALRIAEYAERIRAAIERLEFGDVVDGITVTVSAGVAQRSQREPLQTLIDRADTALYEAKRAGRNCVRLAL